MAILTKAQLEALNQSSFPDNTTGAITPEILRTYNSATIESLVDSLDTGSYTTDSEFNAFTSSVDAKFTTIGSQSGSWGGGSINTGSFATTGSNTFVGNQTISNNGELNGIFFDSGSEFFLGQNGNGNLVISSSAESRIIQVNPSSGWMEVYAPQTNFNQNVSLRSTTNVRNVQTDTGNGYVAQFDGFTASLQEGYAWVGKSGGTSISVPTSSFGGATIVGYATTGSNNFVGDQTITGSVNISGGEHLFVRRSTIGAVQDLRLGATDNENNFAFIVTGSDTNPGQQVWGINIAGSTWANSFDAGVVFNSYVTASNGIQSNGNIVLGNGGDLIIKADPLNDPYNGVAIKQTGNNFSYQQIATSSATFNIAATDGVGFSYSTEVLATSTPTSTTFQDFNMNTFAYNTWLTIPANNTTNGLNPKPIFNRGLEVTGSVNLTPASVSTNANYPLTFVSGTTLSKDSVDTLLYNPSTNQLLVSGTTGNSNISPNAITFQSGSGAYGTYASTISKNGFISSVEGGNYISIQGNPSKTGSPSLTTSTNPAILALSSSGQPYPAIELQPSASFTDGRVTFKRRLVAQQNAEFTGSLTASGSATIVGQLKATFDQPSNNAQIDNLKVNSWSDKYGYTIANSTLGWQRYEGTVEGWVQELYTGDYAYGSSVRHEPSQMTWEIYPSGSAYDSNLVTLKDNGNTTTTFKVLSDTTEITGSVGVKGNLTIQSGNGDLYVHGHKQFNIGSFQSNVTQSGSANVSQSIQIETTDLSYGVSVVDNTKMTVANAGVYNIQFSAQIDRVTGSGTDDVYFWLKKNGTNVPSTTGVETISGGALEAKTLAAWNYVVDAAANDYFEIVWQTTDSNIHLPYAAATGNIPAIPSMIATVTQVR